MKRLATWGRNLRPQVGVDRVIGIWYLLNKVSQYYQVYWTAKEQYWLISGLSGYFRLRSLIDSQKEIISKLELLEKKDLELDEKVTLIFEYLKKLEQSNQEETDFKTRKRIGFKPAQ